MDERSHPYIAGRPIPVWDLGHRLPIDKPVGPICADSGTVFRINSTYMDVTDQPHLERQWLGTGVLMIVFCAIASICFAGYVCFEPRIRGGEVSFLYAVFTCTFVLASYYAFRTGRDEFFALTRRTIRFNRKEQKIHAIRRRRFFAKPGEGDVTCEIPWDTESIFCVHASGRFTRLSYHIRHYAVDEAGNVLRAVSIGAEWSGWKALPELLAQWNYWCEYMNQGPAALPSPRLFFSERESMRESYALCRQRNEFAPISLWTIIFLPFVLIDVVPRLLALWTCRAPVWPDWVEALSRIEPSDTHEQPRGETPVGWADTAMARTQGRWPFDPMRPTSNWNGEQDAERNALPWTADTSWEALNEMVEARPAATTDT